MKKTVLPDGTVKREFNPPITIEELLAILDKEKENEKKEQSDKSR